MSSGTKLFLLKRNIKAFMHFFFDKCQITDYNDIHALFPASRLDRSANTYTFSHVTTCDFRVHTVAQKL